MSESLDAWIADLARAQELVGPEGEKVLGKGALNIKTEWRRRWSGYAHIPHLPSAIDYEVHRAGADAWAEVGPRRDREQGGLGSYIELGTVNNPPIPGGLPALDAEEPRFVSAVADLGEKLLAER